MRRFGVLLRRARLARDLSPRALAARMAPDQPQPMPVPVISEKLINMWEHGQNLPPQRHDLFTFLAVAQGLGLERTDAEYRAMLDASAVEHWVWRLPPVTDTAMRIAAEPVVRSAWSAHPTGDLDALLRYSLSEWMVTNSPAPLREVTREGVTSTLRTLIDFADLARGHAGSAGSYLPAPAAMTPRGKGRGMRTAAAAAAAKLVTLDADLAGLAALAAPPHHFADLWLLLGLSATFGPGDRVAVSGGINALT